MKISIQTLGCKVNQSESSSLEGALRNNNHKIVKPSDNPDIVIINTCTVTAKSDYQSRQLVRRAVKTGARVIATGCYAQLKPDELLEIEGVNLVVGNSEKDNLLKHVGELEFHNDTGRALIEAPNAPLHSSSYYSTRSRAFLKIQDGCNFSCSYCTVPLARGKSRSMGEGDVLSSVEHLIDDGYNEIVITGIHVGSYGADLVPRSTLPAILKKLIHRFPDTRFRISSIEPQEFNEELIELLNEENVCRHLHIPLQSGSDRILRGMNRGYTTDYYKQLIHRITTSFPDISIGADVIVGYPGESDKDFDDTVNYLTDLPLTYFHVFPYSKRPHTRASQLDESIHLAEEIKKKRVKTLISISNEKKSRYISKHLGAMLNVIVENKSSKGSYYKAISDNYLRVLVKSDHLRSGQFLRVKVSSLTESELIAQPL